jgi:hypothetical protein
MVVGDDGGGEYVNTHAQEDAEEVNHSMLRKKA